MFLMLCFSTYEMYKKKYRNALQYFPSAKRLKGILIEIKYR